jgi:flavodoxin
MKYLVTYWSQTGNTKKVAETIFDALTGEKTIKPFDEVENPGGFDLIFVGFPVMQFGPPQAVKRILAPQTAGKRIALFVTHAMLTKSEDPLQQAMLAKEMTRCRDAFSASEIAGVFHCQG